MRPLWKISVNSEATFQVSGKEVLLDEGRSAGHLFQYSCRNGRCGVCRARLTEGSVEVIKPDLSLTPSEREQGYFLTCSNRATADCSIEAALLDELISVTVKTVPCRIDAIESPAPDVRRILLRIPPNMDLVTVPGQYVDVIGKGGLRRSYSIGNARGAKDRIELHVRQVQGGAMSSYWFGPAKVNDLLRLEGPLGTFVLRQPDQLSGKTVVFFATGTGFAPLKAMLEQLSAIPGFFERNDVHLFWGGRRPEDLYCSMDAFPAVDFHAVLSRPADGSAGSYVQHAAVDRLATLDGTVVYACGSQAMVNSARDLLLQKGLAKNDFHHEAFVVS